MPKNDMRLSSLTDKKRAYAQKKLDALCRRAGLKPWNIGSGKGRWRDLVFALCDIEPLPQKKAGRPKVGENIDNKFYQRVLADQVFRSEKKPIKTSLQDVASFENTQRDKKGIDKVSVDQIRAGRNRAKKRIPKDLEDLAKNYSSDE